MRFHLLASLTGPALSDSLVEAALDTLTVFAGLLLVLFVGAIFRLLWVRVDVDLHPTLAPPADLSPREAECWAKFSRRGPRVGAGSPARVLESAHVAQIIGRKSK